MLPSILLLSGFLTHHFLVKIKYRINRKFMYIQLVKMSKMTRPLYLFLDGISENLLLKIFNKCQSYVQYGSVYSCKHLKTLNARIWKYKGTIYKLRVDHGRESARVLFAKSKAGDLVIIHAFLKSTRKTPAKEARQAIDCYQNLTQLETVKWNLARISHQKTISR